jgi:F-type H+-transporting ATPase subunit epsilon
MRLSLTTPRGALVDQDVDEVNAPGVLGEFGVLPGHVPFLSALRPGVLVYRAQGVAHVVAVRSGALEVVRQSQGDKVLVLCGDAEPARDIDREAAVRELADMDSEIARFKGETDGHQQAVLARRAWAAVRVDAAASVAS